MYKINKKTTKYKELKANRIFRTHQSMFCWKYLDFVSFSSSVNKISQGFVKEWFYY